MELKTYINASKELRELGFEGRWARVFLHGHLINIDNSIMEVPFIVLNKEKRYKELHEMIRKITCFNSENYNK